MECGPEPMICSLNYQSSGFPAVWLKLQIMECGPEPLLITACLQQRLNVTELHQPVWKQIVRLHSDRAVDQLRDRKSTRLNSSHVAISYAVFCLKKKTTMSTDHLGPAYI